ncbi:bacteriocin ABC transporter [Spiroplasma clarkii]|nr:cysteine peptidase family C39 domain-containing protein [Spiroplasma clarkii]ARU91446.1 bacteriocin ABC transporter [Spiroplasma clarkii]
MQYKFIQQKINKDCGVAVTCMLINYLQNSELTIEELKYQSVVFDNELSFYNLELIFAKYNIEFKSYYASFEDFCELCPAEPMILNLVIDYQEHFIVVYKIKGTKVLVGDPNDKDIKWIQLKELQTKFSGYFGIARKLNKYKFKVNSLFNWSHFLFEDIKNFSFYFVIAIMLNLAIMLANGF